MDMQWELIYKGKLLYGLVEVCCIVHGIIVAERSLANCNTKNTFCSRVAMMNTVAPWWEKCIQL
jgi:hypothetical protein